MKNLKVKRFLALALLAVSLFAVAVPAMAAYRPWQYRWGVHTLIPNDYTTDATKIQQCKNLQNDLNFLVTHYSGFTFGWLTVDGQYGPATANAIRQVQSYFGLSVDGKCGPATKNALWNFLGYTPHAD